jgi:hypothetical protein
VEPDLIMSLLKVFILKIIFNQVVSLVVLAVDFAQPVTPIPSFLFDF